MLSPRLSAADWLDLIDLVPIGAMMAQGTSSADLREQTRALQDHSAILLLVAADLEHGAVALTDETELPWMMGAGAANDAVLEMMDQNLSYWPTN